MSVDSTSSSVLFGKKTLKSTLSQPDQTSSSRYSIKLRSHKPATLQRTMPVSEETSGDILTDLSTLPYMPHKQDVNRRNRRFSELKPGLTVTNSVPNTDRDRRNSTPQLNFSSLLPNHFRSHKHTHKNIARDETNTSFDTSDNSFSSSFNDTMTMRAESSSSKTFNSNASGSRTNLSISSELSSTIYPEETLSSLFTLDSIPSEPRTADTMMLQLNSPLCVSAVYREHFFEYFHTNYSGELQHDGPFIASLRYITNKSDPPTCKARAIIRIPSRNYDVSVPADEANEDNILQVLFKKAYLPGIQTCKPIGDPKANQKIYSFDKSNDDRQNCKIGFIYQRADQTDEAEIFNNDTPSNEMIDFLEILADHVRLKGFDKYRGDLDIKNDLHGEYSYYTQYNNREIMFNVAPIVPSTNTTNGLCVKRKGLVGNSFVCIVFQDTNAEFIPDIISGKVTQIYITVKPIKINQQTYYKISIWHRNDLTSIIDPPGGIYESDKSFRDYFLTLLLNSINVAIESPSLRYCISEQRQRLKQEDMKRLVQNFSSSGLTLDTTSDVENGISHVSIENRSNSRTDSTISSTTDNNNNHLPDTSGRVSPAPVKKRTLSKIFSVFSSRSGSLSTPTNTSNNDLTANTPPASEGNRTVTSSNRESMKRAASVKHHPAPSPPVQTRAPISYKYSIPKSTGVITDSPNLHNNFLNVAALEESVRSRSNSSPDDRANTTTKRPLSSVSTASKEISDTSSIGDFSGDEYSEDEKYEHRPTLTEPSSIPSANTNL